MRHTYFFDSLEWTAAGTYYDEKGGAFPLTGAVRIRHDGTEWTLGGYLQVEFDPPARFTNDYQIERVNEQTLRWASYNPALGTLKGTFEVIGDAILSHYISTDGVYSGTETLLQKDERTYENVGVSFKNGERMSAWTATLRAVSSGTAAL